jgi:hypothetical protein
MEPYDGIQLDRIDERPSLAGLQDRSLSDLHDMLWLPGHDAGFMGTTCPVTRKSKSIVIAASLARP